MPDVGAVASAIMFLPILIGKTAQMGRRHYDTDSDDDSVDSSDERSSDSRF